MVRIIIAKILRRLGLAKHLNFNYRIKYGISILKIPMDYGALESFLRVKSFVTFKSSIIDILKNFASTDYFVDVGANCGSTLVEVFGNNPEINYLGFEPNNNSFKLLSKIVQLNQIKATLFPFACTDESKVIRLFLNSDFDPCATIDKRIKLDAFENYGGLPIAGYKLDDALPNTIPNSFILKIDVEGSEVEVIKGGLKTINSKRPFMITEVLNSMTKKEIDFNNSRKLELEKILKEINYKIYLLKLHIKGDKLEKIQKVKNFPRNLLYENSENLCDYIFVPDEASQKFEEAIPKIFL